MRILLPLRRSLNQSSSKVQFTNRTFFASSTDHTTLLSNATSHRILQDDNNPYGPRSYILLPNGTPLDLAQKVDKLHLARLYADRNIMYGAKVVQRSLGTLGEVAAPLVQMAIDDIHNSKQTEELIMAIASLDGLTKWVANGIEKENEIDILQQLKQEDESSYEAIKAIATGIPRPGHSVVGQGTYRDGEEAWRSLATEFVNEGLSEEAELYKGHGGVLSQIDHLGDTSREGLLLCGGARAILKFDKT